METDVQKKKKTSQDKTRNRKRPQRERERDRQIEKFTELSVSQMFVMSHQPQQK